MYGMGKKNCENIARWLVIILALVSTVAIIFGINHQKTELQGIISVSCNCLLILVMILAIKFRHSN